MLYTVNSWDSQNDNSIVSEYTCDSYHEAMAYVINQLATIVNDDIAIGDITSNNNIISAYMPEIETRVFYHITR